MYEAYAKFINRGNKRKFRLQVGLLPLPDQEITLRMTPIYPKWQRPSESQQKIKQWHCPQK